MPYPSWDPVNVTITEYASESENAAASTPATWVRYGRFLRPSRFSRIAALLSSRASVIAVDPMLGSHGARRSCGHHSPSTSPAPSPSPRSTPRGYEPRLYVAAP